MPGPGVLALQGGFAAHGAALSRLGLSPGLVRTPQDLERVDSLILPGGESTVMIRLLRRTGLLGPLKRRISQGLPVFGTCAGMVLLSSGVDGRDQETLEAMDYTVERNAYGRQAASFETQLSWQGGRIPAVFIRAPRIRSHPGERDVLISYEGTPVLLRQGRCLAASFHPELTDSLVLHRYFLEHMAGRRIRL